jgi:hypothetical protein
MQVTVERGSPKTQQHAENVFLTNRLSQTCRLNGYPTIKLLDREGRALPFLYRHAGDQMVTNTRPKTVSIPPGGRAVFVFNNNTCVLTPASKVRLAKTLLIQLPGSRQTKAARIPRSFTYSCAANDLGRILTVSPIEPSLTAASAGP